MIARVSETTGVILRRYVQFAVDRLLLFVALMVLFVVALVIVATTPRGDGRHTLVYVMATVVILLVVVGNWFIEVWVPYRWLGGTPGMRWLGLRVVTEDGETPRLKAYMYRWLMSVVDGYLFGLVGAAAIAFSPRHQRFGDMVAHTVVVRRVPQPTR